MRCPDCSLTTLLDHQEEVLRDPLQLLVQPLERRLLEMLPAQRPARLQQPVGVAGSDGHRRLGLLPQRRRLGGDQPRCRDARRDRCGRTRRELRQKRVGRADAEKDYRQTHAVGTDTDGAHREGALSRTGVHSRRELLTRRQRQSLQAKIANVALRVARYSAARPQRCKRTVGLSARQVPGGPEQPHTEQQPAVRSAGPIWWK